MGRAFFLMIFEDGTDRDDTQLALHIHTSKCGLRLKSLAFWNGFDSLPFLLGRSWLFFRRRIVLPLPPGVIDGYRR